MKQKFDITGMTCSACSSHVEKSVNKLNGINTVSVNLLTNSMQVDFDPERLSSQMIIEAVEHAGYGASISDLGKNLSETKETKSKEGSFDNSKTIKKMKVRLIVSILFLIPLMYISMGHMIYVNSSLNMPTFMENYFHGNENAITFAFTQFILLLPIVIANQKYFTNGFKTLVKRSPNMDSLIAIGAGAAIVYGIYAIFRIGYGLGHGDIETVTQYSHDLYFESAGTILTLITVGKYLESRSKGKTSEAITKLINLAPKTVTVIRNGKEQVIGTSDIVVDDVFMIKPGESVAVDGVVLEGHSSFDESAITGESIPVLKQEGDQLISASINKSGLILAKATKVGENTTLSKIIKLVEEASSSKAPIAKLADKIAGIFVPIVIIIAFITFIVWMSFGASFEFALVCAIAVLVISCPCALGLATPVAIMVGTGKGAENGILIKSGEALETAHMIDTVVLDKTGTITQGRPVVTDVWCNHQISEDELLTIAGTIELGSEHPLAEAIVNEGKRRGLNLQKVKDFHASFGMGIEGKINEVLYYAGNEKLMKEKKIVLSNTVQNKLQSMAQEGKTPLMFADKEQILGIIGVADIVKPTSKEAIKSFKKYDIHVIMLTGDNEVTANAIKSQVGIDEVIAGVLPTGKEEKIRQLKDKGHKVAMIGDGINDAPALASADVGIAIGAGTDVAIESADIVLMKNDLLDAVGAIKLSKSVIRNIKENLFWAFFYNTIGIPVAAGVLYPIFQIKLDPMIGAAAMSLSSVCVVLNALRLRKVKLNKSNNEERQDHNDLPQKFINIEKGKDDGQMTKTIMIEGMSCGHCTARVEKALRAVDGVKEVIMSLEDKKATITLDLEVSDNELTAVVVDAGYEVIEIK